MQRMQKAFLLAQLVELQARAQPLTASLPPDLGTAVSGAYDSGASVANGVASDISNSGVAGAAARVANPSSGAPAAGAEGQDEAKRKDATLAFEPATGQPAPAAPAAPATPALALLQRRPEPRRLGLLRKQADDQPMPASPQESFVAPTAGPIADAQSDEDGCAAVRDEVYARVAQHGWDATEAHDECQAGTFDCLVACPELHTLAAHDEIATECAPGHPYAPACAKWLQGVKTCVDDTGVCGATLFRKLDGFDADGPLDAAQLTGLLKVTTDMENLVRSMQEAFESTFMTPCNPACPPDGSRCIQGSCVFRPFENRVEPPASSIMPKWWKEFARERPNHPQVGYWIK